jgi:hypothetical protein
MMHIIVASAARKARACLVFLKKVLVAITYLLPGAGRSSFARLWLLDQYPYISGRVLEGPAYLVHGSLAFRVLYDNLARETM